MLRHWGIDASGHCPRQVDRELCDQASAIFVMAPAHLRRLLRLYGEDLDRKSYLFADPFSQPRSFYPGEYKVYDPSFDPRPTRGVGSRMWLDARTSPADRVGAVGAQARSWFLRPSISR